MTHLTPKPNQPRPVVLVLGGTGFYGSYLVNDLLANTDAHILIVSRRPYGHLGLQKESRIRRIKCDFNNIEELTAVAEHCDMLVNMTGSYDQLNMQPLKAALEAECHYIDIAEDRQFGREVKRLASKIKMRKITAISGASVSPSMEVQVAKLFAPRFDKLTSLRTFATPDTKKHRGYAMFRTMLRGVGRPYLQPRNGHKRLVYGWTEPEWVMFPPPIGERLTHLVLEMANLDELPAAYDIGTVEFKVGTELAFANKLLNKAARLRQKHSWLNWEKWTNTIRAFSGIVGLFGKDEGAVFFEISGQRNGRDITEYFAIVAEQDGGHIPSILAAMASEKLIDGSLTQRGLQAQTDWLPTSDFINGLKHRNLKLWWIPAGYDSWKQFVYEKPVPAY